MVEFRGEWVTPEERDRFFRYLDVLGPRFEPLVRPDGAFSYGPDGSLRSHGGLQLAPVKIGFHVSVGGNADGTTGDFSLGLRGHMIENGTVGRPVGEMNVTGNLRDLFGRLELVGNDVYPYSSTLSPSLVFGGVDFSGA